LFGIIPLAIICVDMTDFIIIIISAECFFLIIYHIKIVIIKIVE